MLPNQFKNKRAKKETNKTINLILSSEKVDRSQHGAAEKSSFRLAKASFQGILVHSSGILSGSCWYSVANLPLNLARTYLEINVALAS